MRLVSLLVSVRPDALERFRRAIATIPGVREHGEAADSKVVVTIEDTEGHELMPSMLAVQGLPGVLATTLTYEYCDDEPDCLEKRP